ncbi:unnamed protein product [Meganyctiphanes norvegica]|uniref:Spaetzle domain-containing protein n=1 Tax=Meganyctiphanes norvegica TaxID=48144 RepID=A0AAV2R0R4_MEGNR
MARGSIVKIVATLLLGLFAVGHSLPHPQNDTPNEIRPSYRSSKTPKCTLQNPNPNAPCENDPEYDAHIKARFSKILDTQSMSQLQQAVLAMGLDSIQLSDPMMARRRRSVENREITFPTEGVAPDSTTDGVTPLATEFEFVEETAACSSVKSILFPKRGKTKADNWVFILNQENEQQGVTVETCHSEGSSCNLGGVIPGVETACRQKYVYKTFLVMNEGENVVPEEILMPSTCVCYVRRN